MKNNFPKFINNKPTGTDDFEGQSHNRIAENISNHIIGNNGLRVIGIEGEWGSGKSNIVEIIKRKLKKTHYVYIYDSWGHQEDSQRKAFLEELTDELILENILKKKTTHTDISGSKEKISWEEKLKYLLSNKRITKSKVIPKVKSGIIITAIIVILTPILSLMSSYIGESKSAVILKLLFSTSLIIITLIVFIISTFWKKYISSKKEWINLASLFMLYKDSSLENTTYEILSENEPSVKEFKTWMDSISCGLIKTKNLIIVYDNMDRLPKEKVKDIWSSIHTFFSEKTYKNIWLVIPFDRSHMEEAFEDKEGSNTDDFINKTFSVLYRVSPPVLTDWKAFFTKKITEAFGNHEESKLLFVRSVFDRLQPKLTPRNIIVFINELVTLKQIWENKIPIEYIALYILKKKQLLKDPKKEILNKKFTGNATNLFSDNTKLLNYISALVYNVPVERASQLLLLRDMELCLMGSEESELSLNDMIIHGEFIDILEDVIQNSGFDLHITISQLSKINISKIAGKSINGRLEEIWDELISRQSKTDLVAQNFDLVFEPLLLNSSKNKIIKFVNYLVSQLRNFKKFNGKRFFISMESIESFISENKIDLNLKNFISRKEVTPEIFLDYLYISKENYTKFELYTEPDKLDQYISEVVTNNLQEEIELKYLVEETNYSFKKTKTIIEEIIENSAYNDETINSILNIYKSISLEKPLSAKLSINQLYPLISKNQYEDELYNKLIAIRLTYGRDYNKSLKKSNWVDGIIETLKNDDENFTKNIAEEISFFGDYGDLLTLTTTWTTNLLIAVCKELTVNNYDIFCLDIKNVLINFDEIKNSIDVTETELLNRLNEWSDSITDEITSENVENYIPNYDFFNYSTVIDIDLTKHINKSAISFLKDKDTEEVIDDWGDDESYFYNSLYIYMKNNKIRVLPSNVFNALKEIFKSISEDKIAIPDGEIWSYFIEKTKKSEIIPTIKNIRDKYIRDNDITPEHFLFFLPFFIDYGQFEEKAGDVTRIIISKVIEDEDCFKLIILNSKLFTKLINDAKDDAADVKEIFQKKLNKNLEDKELIKFCKKISIKPNK